MPGIVEQINPEFLSSEYLPVVAAGVGMAVGAGLDLIAQRKMAQDRDPISPEWGRLVEAPTRRRRVLGAVIGPIAFVAMGAGYVNADAWQPEQGVQTGPPVVEIVVDYSGATVLGDGQSVARITELTEGIGQMENTDTGAWVARGGIVVPTAPEEVSQQQPVGEARLGEATTNALASVEESTVEADTNNEQHNSAVVVLTDGNDVARAEAIIAEAEDNSTPIYVVNVQPNSTSDQEIVDNLQALAEGTGGEYWTQRRGTVENVTQTLSENLDETITPEDQQPSDNKNEWPARALGAFMVGGVGVTYWMRKNMPLLFNKSKLKGSE